MPGDVLDLSWIHKHAKEHDLIPSRLVKISVCRLLVPSNMPKMVQSTIFTMQYNLVIVDKQCFAVPFLQESAFVLTMLPARSPSRHGELCDSTLISRKAKARIIKSL